MWSHGGWDILEPLHSHGTSGDDEAELALPGQYWKRTGIRKAFAKWAYGTEEDQRTPWLGALLSHIHQHRLNRAARRAQTRRQPP